MEPDSGSISNSLGDILTLVLPRVSSPAVTEMTLPCPSLGTRSLNVIGTNAVLTRVAILVHLKPIKPVQNIDIE